MAITSQDPRSSTPKTGLPFPLHRLNTPQTKVWLISPHARNGMAVQLARRYPGGVGVLSATQRLFAMVDPKGNVRDLPPPHRLFEMWQIANAPRAPECPCANFIDLEVQGPWRERGPEAGHHPLCQFDRTAAHVFQTAARVAVERVQNGGPAQERPDEWLRIRKDALASGK